METLRIAIAALQAHKLRSFLTLLGVIIGVMTVISVVSIIAGLNSYIAEKVFQLNPNVFVATQFGIITSREEFLEAVRRKKVDTSDLRAIEARCDRCDMIGANIQTQMPVKFGDKRAGSIQIFGRTSNMAELNNVDLEAGHYFTPLEEHHSALVAVIGDGVRQELFGSLDPVGRSISIGGHPMKVIGVLTKQGSVLGQNQDNQLHIPITTFRKAFGSRRSIDIYVRAAGGVPGVPAAQDEVRTILRSRRHTAFKAKDPFAIVTAESLQTVWRNISRNAFALMVFISAISLLVGGIVITNIMLVSVIERTKEIGIRRAIGATRRDIQLQFLTEAVLLALGGGVAGVLLGATIAKLISTFFPLPTLVRPSLIITGLAIAVLTGAVAGFFPARKASRLAPVEALRYE